MGAFAVMIDDRANKILKDFTVSPIRSSKIGGSLYPEFGGCWFHHESRHVRVGRSLYLPEWWGIVGSARHTEDARPDPAHRVDE